MIGTEDRETRIRTLQAALAGANHVAETARLELIKMHAPLTSPMYLGSTDSLGGGEDLGQKRRRPWSRARRLAHSERMRKQWAARKKARGATA